MKSVVAVYDAIVHVVATSVPTLHPQLVYINYLQSLLVVPTASTYELLEQLLPEISSECLDIEGKGI